MQHTRRITNTTRIEGHVDDLALDLRRLPWVAIVQEEGATGTALLAAAVALLALTSRAMADKLRTVAVRTVQDLENNGTSQTCWGESAPRRSQRIAYQHL